MRPAQLVQLVQLVQRTRQQRKGERSEERPRARSDQGLLPERERERQRKRETGRLRFQAASSSCAFLCALLRRRPRFVSPLLFLRSGTQRRRHRPAQQPGKETNPRGREREGESGGGPSCSGARAQTQHTSSPSRGGPARARHVKRHFRYHLSSGMCDTVRKMLTCANAHVRACARSTNRGRRLGDTPLQMVNRRSVPTRPYCSRARRVHARSRRVQTRFILQNKPPKQK